MRSANWSKSTDKFSRKVGAASCCRVCRSIAFCIPRNSATPAWRFAAHVSTCAHGSARNASAFASVVQTFTSLSENATPSGNASRRSVCIITCPFG